MPYLSYEYLWRNGRLGNQLWQIASTAGIAFAEGAEPRFPKWEYSKFFNVPEEFFVDRLPAERRDLGTDYLQELRHIDSIDDQVQEWFLPSDQVQSWLDSHHEWFFAVPHTTALHVRRGDYTKNPKHFPLPTVDYYRNACREASNDFPGTTFVVFSDDIVWCEENLSEDVFEGPAKFVHGVPRPVEMNDRKGEPEDQYDLFLMSLCDNHIISNSTFSWWGAYLAGNDQAIYPSVWFGPALNNQECPAPDTWRKLQSC